MVTSVDASATRQPVWFSVTSATDATWTPTWIDHFMVGREVGALRLS